jgi:hypothetical protein
MRGPAYDPNHPTRPVPIERQAEVLAFAATRWFDLFDSLARFSTRSDAKVDAYTWFDADAAMTDASATLTLLAELAQIVGDETARRWLDNALEKARARRAA